MLDKFHYKEALSAENFRAQTLAQLQNDLNRAQCGYNIGNIDFISELAVLLESLPSEKRAQLLYLIDLPETNPSLISSGDLFLDLAEQIIHREALKVYLRNHFSTS